VIFRSPGSARPNLVGIMIKKQTMDTDDLSNQTYAAIIVTAEKFHPDLTLQFGLLADGCNTDNEFLDVLESLIRTWLTDWDLEEAIRDIFFEDPPDKKAFKKILDQILINIGNTRKIPMKKRKFDNW
jgi:hypothetical protein